ncbi:VOC family protein [Frankia gtarii]|uniref:VOC family protein n=1 Tax=Frankia gtarii TaxID=2950102 RepID=UPI0021C09C00|nr:VOC family protein [Frankia gtarii]
MSPIRAVLARVYVESLDAALPLYQRLAGDAPTRRFGFRDVELAWVGPFLLVAGTPAALAPLRNRAATMLVDDLDAVASTITSAGGALIEGPGESPNGTRLIAEHPDGTVFEYLHIAT